MLIRQLTIFLENRSGHLLDVCRVLRDADINILALSLADTTEFGIARLIVNRVDDALQALQRAEISARTSDVVAVQVAHQPGGLASLLQVVHDCGLQVEYTYACPCAPGENALLIVRFRDTEEALARLQKHDLSLLTLDDIG